MSLEKVVFRANLFKKIGLKYADPSDIIDSQNLLDKWKLLIPRSPIAG